MRTGGSDESHRIHPALVRSDRFTGGLQQLVYSDGHCDIAPADSVYGNTDTSPHDRSYGNRGITDSRAVSNDERRNPGAHRHTNVDKLDTGL